MIPKIKQSIVKKFVVVGAVLAALQIGVIYLLSDGTQAPDQKEAINQAVSKLNDLTAERKQMVRIQIALADYIAKNQGKPPGSLLDLVPTYFDSLPPDPSTGKPFKYKVDGSRYFLGEQTTAASTGNAPGTSKSAPGKPGSAGGSDADKDALLATLSEEPGKSAPPYDPTGKRDPFKAFDLAPKQDGALAKSALESIPIDRLSYSAYLQSENDPKAIIETIEGRGFTVSKGTKVGPNGGEITEIFPDKIIIVETEVDFTGEKRSRTAELYMGMKSESGSRRPQIQIR